MFNFCFILCVYTVFMKDVSKDILEDLITFIYHGEVRVNQNNLEAFFKTAKALEIRGLADRNCSQLLEPKCSASIRTSLANPFNGSQYQSTRTIPIQNSVNEKVYPESSQSFTGTFFSSPESALCEQPKSDYKQCENSAYGRTDDANYDYDCSDYDMGSNNTLMNQHTQDIQWNNSDENEKVDVPQKSSVTKVKRTKRTNGKQYKF